MPVNLAHRGRISFDPGQAFPQFQWAMRDPGLQRHRNYPLIFSNQTTAE
jgi:hypothetical protein